MFWLMSSCPKTAKALPRPAARGRVSGARRRNSGLQSTGFHQCLGLLKKHNPKIPPANPISTSIYASKGTSISASKYTTIRATTSRGTGRDRISRSLFGPTKPCSSPRPREQKPGRRAGRQRMAATAATAQRRGATRSRPFACEHGERPGRPSTCRENGRNEGCLQAKMPPLTKHYHRQNGRYISSPQKGQAQLTGQFGQNTKLTAFPFNYHLSIMIRRHVGLRLWCWNCEH